HSYPTDTSRHSPHHSFPTRRSSDLKRIKGLAHNQFTGTADILETMQESLQGIRTVKAFTLEQTMRERIDASIAAVEGNANKMARSEEHTSELQSPYDLVCRLLLEKK